jgi:Flp pilus assembly protein TadG
VLITPVILALLLLVVTAGRYGAARADVDAASRDAARAASLERSPAAAEDAAEAAARRRLDDREVVCRDFVMALDVSEFRSGGSVSATVSCQADLSDVSGLGLPGSVGFEATFSHPVDTYRGADE